MRGAGIPLSTTSTAFGCAVVPRDTDTPGGVTAGGWRAQRVGVLTASERRCPRGGVASSRGAGAARCPVGRAAPARRSASPGRGRQGLQVRGEERPAVGPEHSPVGAELSLQDGDLVSQGEDLAPRPSRGRSGAAAAAAAAARRRRGQRPDRRSGSARAVITPCSGSLAVGGATCADEVSGRRSAGPGRRRWRTCGPPPGSGSASAPAHTRNAQREAATSAHRPLGGGSAPASPVPAVRQSVPGSRRPTAALSFRSGRPFRNPGRQCPAVDEPVASVMRSSRSSSNNPPARPLSPEISLTKSTCASLFLPGSLICCARSK